MRLECVDCLYVRDHDNDLTCKNEQEGDNAQKTDSIEGNEYD